MKAKVFSHRHLIGTAELKTGDESMGHLYGDFLPTDDYYSKVQKVVWEFNDADIPDYQKWHSLRLNVQLDNGYFIYAAGGLTIDDLPDFASEQKQIDIAGVDEYVIADFIKQNPPRPFVEEPWNILSIDQKLAFEDELKKELGIAESSKDSDFYKPNEEKHSLADLELSALCTDQQSDDVLFRINKAEFANDFAVVHLTWKGKRESPGYPKFILYKDLDEFKYLRMFPDKVDWEL